MSDEPYGFFSWEDSEQDLWEFASPNATVYCPNCGNTVSRSLMMQHECRHDMVDAYHLTKFHAEWQMRYTPAPGGGQLVAWQAFDRWAETPAGRFAMYEATRERLNG